MAVVVVVVVDAEEGEVTTTDEDEGGGRASPARAGGGRANMCMELACEEVAIGQDSRRMMVLRSQLCLFVD